MWTKATRVGSRNMCDTKYPKNFQKNICKMLDKQATIWYNILVKNKRTE